MSYSARKESRTKSLPKRRRRGVVNARRTRMTLQTGAKSARDPCRRPHQHRYPQSPRTFRVRLHVDVLFPRRRSSSSSSAKSYTSSSSLGRRRGYPSQDPVKGIERQELPQPVKNRETDFTNRANLKRRRSSQSSSRSYSSNSSTDWRRRRPSREGDRNTRRRRSSISPDRRGRDRSIPGMRHRRRSQTRSRDRSQITRNRQSMTPASPQHRGLGIGRASQWKARHQPREAGPAAEYDDTKSHWTAPSDSRGKGTSRSSRRSPPTRKDRSLSPFSKRLALTQAMNMGVR